MRIIKQPINREEVIKAYIKYDSLKKRGPDLPLDELDWDDPNSLDNELQAKGYKSGVITGYKAWSFVELTGADLGDCAVLDSIFKGCPRSLGELSQCDEFEAWKPDRKTQWYDSLEAGEKLPMEWPLILRPSVKSEEPAKWYIEDGSGRAICFYRYLVNNPRSEGRAFGFLGTEPDIASTFMKDHFSELLPPFVIR